MAQVRTVEGRFTPGGMRTGAAGGALVRRAIDPAVAAEFEVDIGDLRAPTCCSPRTAFARQVAMYLAHVVCGLNMTEVGAMFRRDRTTVAHGCGVVEDRRDDPELDARIEHLEHAVGSLIEALGSRQGVRR